MAHTVTVAAIKSSISHAIDALVSETEGTPLIKELEACLERTIATLKVAGTISSVERIEDS